MKQPLRTIDFQTPPTKRQKAETASKWYAQVYHGLADFSHRTDAYRMVLYCMYFLKNGP